MKTNPSILILFDGVCNLCNGTVQFIIRNDPHGKFKFASLQSEFAKLVLKPFDVSGDSLQSILVIEKNVLYQQSDAALKIVKELKGAWSALYILKVFPKFFRDAIYRFIAANRYRIFGRRDSCMIPTPELKSRFLDQ